MFPVIMLILQLLGSRFHIGIDPLTAAGHLGHLFENNSVVNGFKGIFSPGKGPVVLAENAGHGDIIFVFEIIHNQKPRIFLIGFLDLLFGQVSHAGDLTVEIIRLSRAVAGDSPAGLGPGGSPGRMGMYDAADLRDT